MKNVNTNITISYVVITPYQHIVAGQYDKWWRVGNIYGGCKGKKQQQKRTNTSTHTREYAYVY